MTERDFLAQIDAIIEEHHLLKNPFYQMWNEGKLTLKMLQEYSQEYYLQVHHFPTFVSATHAACDDIEVRQMLLENLIEEERGSAHHPELWMRFAEALGVERETLSQRDYLPQTRESVQILRALSRSENPVTGLAALYAYESQIPPVSTTKIAGLKEFYGVESEEAVAFFRVHEQVDEIHSAATRAALVKLCQNEDQQQEAIAAVQTAVEALNLLLDGVYEAYCQPVAA